MQKSPQNDACKYDSNITLKPLKNYGAKTLESILIRYGLFIGSSKKDSFIWILESHCQRGR